MSPRIADDPTRTAAATNSPSTGALRPPSLEEFRGQPRVSEQLGLVLAAASIAAPFPTTCCCPARPGWARPRWR